MKSKKIMKRVGLLTLAVLLLCATLASCAGNAAADTKWTAADVDAPTYFARILPLNQPKKDKDENDKRVYSAREIFTAAMNGYNITAADFDDANLVKDPNAVPTTDGAYTVSLDGAKAALALVKPEDDASIAKFNEFCDNLTADQVVDTVNRMKTEVNLSENGFFLLVWVGKFLQLLTKMTGGYYVLALFIFAIVVEALLLYFGVRQQKNSIKQAKLSPKERAIRKKYAGRNDQVSMRKMQEEIQRLYQEEGFNPMGGCGPLLIQMPVIMALYYVVIDPLKYVLGKAAGLSDALTRFATTTRAAGGLGLTFASSNNKSTIELLSNGVLSEENLNTFRSFSYFSNTADCANALSDVTVPNFNLFGLNMGQTPSFTPTESKYFWLLLIPVLTFGLYFLSMKLTRKLSFQPAAQNAQMGCSNNMMDFMMPAMSVFITFITPAAVGLYWLFKCVITMGKQLLLHKLMPLPVFTEEDYKRAEKEMKAKNKGKKETNNYSAAPDGRVYRSLHRIDEEDDLPAKGSVTGPSTAADAEDDEEEAPATANTKTTSDTDAPRLKDDRKNNKK
jgi:YidC/Oxa1 family membrane protein insertase